MTGARSAAVIGLGLIGGSVARELHAQGVQVVGSDADGATLDRAAAEGVVRPMTASLGELDGVDLVVLAVPVAAARAALPAIAERSGDAVVTDVGSTKRAMLDAAIAAGIGERFVGSHPLAGDERSGWAASRMGMFEGARVFITPAAGASPGAVRLVTGTWTSMGGRPELVSAAEHDHLMAWASHAPQAISTALGVALARAGVARGELGPGGRDATRLAGSSPEVWAEILADNADEVAPALRSVTAGLASLTSAVESGNVGELARVLAEARRWATGQP